MRIRRAVVADAEELVKVHIEAWKWAYRGLLPDDYLDRLDGESEARLAMWRRLLSQDPDRSATWVSVEGEKIVGFASTGPSRAPDSTVTDADLLSIYLLEEFAGKGVGRALMSAAVEEMRRQGYLTAVLWVLESNVRAQRFYERAGWSLDGGRQVERRPGFDLVEVRYRTVL